MKKSLLLLFITFSFSAFSQIRQQSSTEGFRVGLQVGRTGWASDYFSFVSTNAGSGFTIGANASYGINQLIEPYVCYEYSSMGTGTVNVSSFSFSHIDAGVRFNFGGTVNKLRPFVQAGYGIRNGSLTQISFATGGFGNVNFNGATPHIGGGVSYFIKPNLALHAKGVATFGSKASVLVNNIDTGEKADVTTFRLTVGVTFNLSDL